MTNDISRHFIELSTMIFLIKRITTNITAEPIIGETNSFKSESLFMPFWRKGRQKMTRQTCEKIVVIAAALIPNLGIKIRLVTKFNAAEKAQAHKHILSLHAAKRFILRT